MNNINNEIYSKEGIKTKLADFYIGDEGTANYSFEQLCIKDKVYSRYNINIQNLIKTKNQYFITKLMLQTFKLAKENNTKYNPKITLQNSKKSNETIDLLIQLNNDITNNHNLFILYFDIIKQQYGIKTAFNNIKSKIETNNQIRIKRLQKQVTNLKKQTFYLEELNSDLFFDKYNLRKKNYWLHRRNNNLFNRACWLQKKNNRLKYRDDNLHNQNYNLKDGHNILDINEENIINYSNKSHDSISHEINTNNNLSISNGKKNKYNLSDIEDREIIENNNKSYDSISHEINTNNNLSISNGKKSKYNLSDIEDREIIENNNKSYDSISQESNN